MGFHALVAQLVEQRPFKLLVVGSSPAERIMSCQGEEEPHANVRSICVHEADGTSIFFIRDSDDKTYVIASGANGAPVLDRNSTTDDAIAFINEFPSCVRCVPLALRRRKAVRAAMRLASIGVVPDKDRI